MLNDETVPLFRATALDRWWAAAIPTSIADLLGSARTLGVVVPHPDDETLGCGGLIAAATARGVTVTVTILTDGSASHPGSIDWPPQRLAARRQSEARNAIAALARGNAQIVFAEVPDGQLDAHPASAHAIPAADLFVTCWRDDPHPDHVAAFAIADTVARRHAAPLLAFPLWTLTTDQPVPDCDIYRLDIGDQLARKRSALAAHASQLGQLVDDVPGFTLTTDLQQLFVRTDELFVRAN